MDTNQGLISQYLVFLTRPLAFIIVVTFVGSYAILIPNTISDLYFPSVGTITFWSTVKFGSVATLQQITKAFYFAVGIRLLILGRNWATSISEAVIPPYSPYNQPSNMTLIGRQALIETRLDQYRFIKALFLLGIITIPIFGFLYAYLSFTLPYQGYKLFGHSIPNPDIEYLNTIFSILLGVPAQSLGEAAFGELDSGIRLLFLLLSLPTLLLFTLLFINLNNLAYVIFRDILFRSLASVFTDQVVQPKFYEVLFMMSIIPWTLWFIYVVVKNAMPL